MTQTMTMPESANGRHRRSLNDTITRLDEMIDGLSVAIPETIRDTLKDSVADAIAIGVKAAVVEVLTNRPLLDAMNRPARLTLRQRLTAAIKRASNTVVRWVRRLVGAVIGTPEKLRERAKLIWSVRRPIVVALMIGAAVGSAAAWTPPWVAGTLIGVGTAGLSLVVQAGLWARRTVQRLVIA
jgi:hypothetical protein